MKKIEIDFEKLKALEDISRLVHERCVRRRLEKEGMAVSYLRTFDQIDEDLDKANCEFFKLADKV